MHHTMTAQLASSRERELRSLVHRPDRRMTHELELERRRTAKRRGAR